MQRDGITDQIKTWLLEESEQQEWKIAINDDDPHYYHCYGIINEKNTILCTICIEKNIDRVIVMNDITFSKQDGTNYKLSREKGKYWIDLKLQLLNLGIDVKRLTNVIISFAIQTDLIYLRFNCSFMFQTSADETF